MAIQYTITIKWVFFFLYLQQLTKFQTERPECHLVPLLEIPNSKSSGPSVSFKKKNQSCLKMFFTRIPVMAPILAPLLGVLFYGVVSPSKIGLIAPYWEAVQALSKARVFLPG
jgi:hypothetical protein